MAKIDSVNYALLTHLTGPYNNDKGNIVVSIINFKTGRYKNIELHRDSIWDDCEVIKWNGEKLLVGSYERVYYWNDTIYESEVTHRGLLYEVDTSGTWRKIVITDTDRSRIASMIVTDEGNYIITFLKIIYYYKEPKFSWQKPERKSRYRLMAMKLDKDFNLLWEKPWGFNFDFDLYFMGWSEILKAEEGDGYILSGYTLNYPWTDRGYLTQAQEDSMKKAGVIPGTVGILENISENGDSIWMHSYSYVRDTAVFLADHYLHDVQYAPDGGYILYGWIDHSPRPGIDTTMQYPGWLVKVDKDGCLIPGCGDTTDTTGLVDIIKDTGVKLYPNPASENLYIYQNTGKDTQYTISDISGRQINRWRGKLSGHTFIVDVSYYKPGIYILTIEREDVIGSRKFVVE